MTKSILPTLIKLFALFAVLDGVITFYALAAYPGTVAEANPVPAALFAFEPMVASIIRLGIVALVALIFWEMGRVAVHRRWTVFWVCVLLDVEVFAVLLNLWVLCVASFMV